MTGRAIRVRRSNCLVFFFKDNELHCKNYLTGREVRASPMLVQILARMNHWRTPGGVERLFPQYSSRSIRRNLNRLIEETALIVRGSLWAKRESALSDWQNWGVEARFFTSPPRIPIRCLSEWMKRASTAR